MLMEVLQTTGASNADSQDVLGIGQNLQPHPRNIQAALQALSILVSPGSAQISAPTCIFSGHVA